jgi:hydroxyacyl-ACP dehydratase HTD2-like protein with hotdog domain
MNTKAARVSWKDVGAGTAVPRIVVRPTPMQLFMFSAVTWNRHHVHYSREAAQSEGLPDVVVHRALLGNFLARALTEWLDDAGDVVALSWKVLQSAVPGREISCGGTVTGRGQGADAGLLDVDLSIVNEQGEAIANGKAQVRLAAAGAS